jgi:gluconokinase
VTRVVVVMGVSGCGKSTVGGELARRLAVPFADADDFHPPANRATMAAGRPLDDADRAPWLDAVAGWIAGHGESGAVVSCSALRRRYRDRLRQAGPELFFLHLDGAPDLIAARLAARHGHFMPPALLLSQIRTLEPLAPDESGATVDIDADPERVAGRAHAAVLAGGHPHVP